MKPLIRKLNYAFSKLRYTVDDEEQDREDADEAKSAIQLAIEDARQLERELEEAIKHLKRMHQLAYTKETEQFLERTK